LNQGHDNSSGIFLLPGEYCVVSEPKRIVTLLGSCVAACLWDRRSGTAGMNHFALPLCPPAADSNCRYGNVAMEQLIQSVLRLCPAKRTLQAQVFGGAGVVEHFGSAGSEIGLRNIRQARMQLIEYGIRITRQEVGGSRGRKIYFDSRTGEVTVKTIVSVPVSLPFGLPKKPRRGDPIRVLTVDDSPTVLAIYKKIITSEPQFTLIGQAQDAYAAREVILSLDPDVITLDLIMPEINGLHFLRRLMKYYPKPVVVISTIATLGSKMQQEASRAGACDVIDKASLSIYGGLDKARNILLPRLKAAAGSARQPCNVT